MIKLHLGCGKRDFPGFINVDLADFPHIQHRRAVNDLSPFENESVDLIYASHVFEYFSLAEAPTVLAEWRRVLKMDGVLKLAVPDFGGLIKAYQRFGDIGQLEGVIYGLIEPDTNHDKTLFHKTMYDFELLNKVLEENGFSNVEYYDWRDFIPAGQEDHSMAYIPSHDYENGIPVGLNVEAKKSSNLEKIFFQTKHGTVNILNKISKKIEKIR